MKIGRRTKRTATVLKSSITKLTLVKFTVVEFIVFCGSSAFRARNILLYRLTMYTFKPISKL